MENSKYELGYLPKIAYWTKRLKDNPKNSMNVEYCIGKLEYFTALEHARITIELRRERIKKES